MFNSILAAQREYSSTETAVGVTIFVVIVAAFYLTPTLIAMARCVPSVGSIAVINVLFGWTGFWWVHSLAPGARPHWPAPPYRPGARDAAVACGGPGGRLAARPDQPGQAALLRRTRLDRNRGTATATGVGVPRRS